MKDKIKITFVCYGNICRSPMAEFIFKNMADKRGLSGFFDVNSAATSDEEIFGGVGNPMYPPAKAELDRRGVPYTPRRAVQLKRGDYEKRDMFIGMDGGNMRDMKAIFGGDPQIKTHKMLSFVGSDGDVSDPWYTRDFAKAFDDICLGCEGLLAFLERN